MPVHDIAHTLRFGTPLAEASRAVILVHGRGASAEDIAGLAGVLPASGTAFLAPDAAQGTWYPQRFFMPLAENEPSLSDGIALLHHLVAEIQLAGLSPGQIGLAGFSQGGCLALEYLVRHPARFAFVAGMSSALIGPAGTPRPVVDLQQVPVLVACAERDPHIPLEFVKSTSATFQDLQADLTTQIFPGGDHTVFQEEIDWIAARMSALPQRP
jgi:predicted esterase